jgi:hypothetical protein
VRRLDPARVGVLGPVGLLIGWAVLVASFTTAATPAHAADTPATPAAPAAPVAPAVPPAPCAEPEYRQFDFWIGDWDVWAPNGNLAGSNRIEKILGGCVLQENWKGARGLTGYSFNTYDPGDKKWHQTWVDDQGTLLLLSGEFKDGKMVLGGATAARGTAKAALQRITWTPLSDGSVRQFWESSEDGGKTWTVAFDGSYRHKK